MKLPFRGRGGDRHEYDEYDEYDVDTDGDAAEYHDSNAFDAPPVDAPTVRARRHLPDLPDQPPVGSIPPPAHRFVERPNRVTGPPTIPPQPRVDPVLVPEPVDLEAESRPPLVPARAAVGGGGSTVGGGAAAGGAAPGAGAGAAPGAAAVGLTVPPLRLDPGTVSADDFSSAFESARNGTGADQASAWAYLGVLSALFVLVAGFGYGCSGRIGGEPAPIEPAAMLASAEPVRIEFRVDGDLVTLRGAVPDLAARDQLIGLAGEVYGPGNVVDNITVESNTTFEEGSLRGIGAAVLGDERPATLRDRISQDFGLVGRGFEVGFSERVLTPAVAVVSIQGDGVALSGTLPDEPSVADLTAIAAEVWGAGSVDASSLVVGDTTWTDGRVQLAGTAVATDARVARFATLVGERIGNLVVVDTSGLAAGDAPELIATQQATVSTLILNSPIQFTPQSAEISVESDLVLVEVAAALAQVPATPVEIVGHTDSLGDEVENQVLSEGRARAVLDRLVSLGVAPERLTARGMGEIAPVADNATEEGQAANRRIEFILVGPSG